MLPLPRSHLSKSAGSDAPLQARVAQLASGLLLPHMPLTAYTIEHTPKTACAAETRRARKTDRTDRQEALPTSKTHNILKRSKGAAV